MDYIENLLLLPIIGTALLFIGSQIFGIELPENEELSDRELRRFDSAMQWDLERGYFAYSAYFNKPHMRIIRLSILACMLPVVPLGFYFIGEISFREMCAVLCFFTFIQMGAYLSELGDEAVKVGLGFSPAYRITLWIGLLINCVFGIIAFLYFFEMIIPDLLEELFAS